MQVDDTPVTRIAPAKPISKRHLTAMELLQTETNYVGILHTILMVRSGCKLFVVVTSHYYYDTLISIDFLREFKGSFEDL